MEIITGVERRRRWRADEKTSDHCRDRATWRVVCRRGTSARDQQRLAVELTPAGPTWRAGGRADADVRAGADHARSAGGVTVREPRSEHTASGGRPGRNYFAGRRMRSSGHRRGSGELTPDHVCGAPMMASRTAAAAWPASAGPFLTRAPGPWPSMGGRCSIVNLVVRSTRVPIAELWSPRMRSLSHCPGTARSSASAGRSLIITSGPTKDLPRPRARQRLRRWCKRRRGHATSLAGPTGSNRRRHARADRRVLARQTGRDQRPKVLPILTPRHPRSPGRRQLVPKRSIRPPSPRHRNIPWCCDDQLNPPWDPYRNDAQARRRRRAGAGEGHVLGHREQSPPAPSATRASRRCVGQRRRLRRRRTRSRSRSRHR